jgi:hypothetical protein
LPRNPLLVSIVDLARHANFSRRRHINWPLSWPADLTAADENSALGPQVCHTNAIWKAIAIKTRQDPGHRQRAISSLTGGKRTSKEIYEHVNVLVGPLLGAEAHPVAYYSPRRSGLGQWPRRCGITVVLCQVSGQGTQGWNTIQIRSTQYHRTEARGGEGNKSR